MANKYLKGGALNPAWCDEQDAELITGSIVDSLYNLFNNMDIGFDFNFSAYNHGS